MNVLRVGALVELREPAMGYEAGSRGVVTDSSTSGRVMVRFEETGHTMLVAPRLLRPVDSRS
jgi:hypothetical protein